MSVWSEEEIADLVDYLYNCRGGFLKAVFLPKPSMI